MEQSIKKELYGQIEAFLAHLRDEEKSVNTLCKYARDLHCFARFLADQAERADDPLINSGGARTQEVFSFGISKEDLLAYKNELCRSYAVSSVNSMLAALNGFLRFLGLGDMRLKALRRQKEIFRDQSKELNQNEYLRLLRVSFARGDERLHLLLQTICSTGIRVGELKYITVEAVLAGAVHVRGKGKVRVIMIPTAMRKMLLPYIEAQNLSEGCVFRTRSGQPLDRSNIWRDLKKLGREAGVPTEKLFPHNLRRLFASVYYGMNKDIARLADILGHSDIRTTHIYIATSGREHEQQLNRMHLVLSP